MPATPSVPDLVETARKAAAAQAKVTGAMRAVSAELAVPPPPAAGDGKPA